ALFEFADVRASRAATACGSVANEFLDPPIAVYFTGIKVAAGIDTNHVRPVELARRAAARSEPGNLLQILTVDLVDCVIVQIRAIEAALLRIAGEIDGPASAGGGLRRDIHLTGEAAFAYLAIGVFARLTDVGNLKHLHAIIPAITRVKQPVV